MDKNSNNFFNNRGGKRANSGRKKTCCEKISYTRRIDKNILMLLKEYALINKLNETEALENAILLQSNIYKQKGDKFMKIVIPSAEGKLCGHFGHCESFTFVDIDKETKEILNIETKIPEEGISCQSAAWIAAQGANVVLAGGMGARPLAMFEQKGIQVFTGCPEKDIRDVIMDYLNNSLVRGENACGGEHHHCHSHSHEGETHKCHGHH